MAQKQKIHFWEWLQRRLTNAQEGSRLAVPLVMAAIVGSTVGLVIVAFIRATDLSTHLFFGAGHQVFAFMGKFWVILIPAAGGLLVGLIVACGPKEWGGMGVAEVMAAITLKGGRIPVGAVFQKFATSVLSLGSGASTGREGPAVLLGSGLGSFLARTLKLGEMRVKNLTACGAAAGIAAVFNAPITGVMFALEVILKDFRAAALSTVVVAAVSASIVSRIFLGEAPAFHAPVHRLHSPKELFLYAGLGLCSALVAVLFIRVFDGLEHFWEKRKIPAWIKPCLGGLIVGLLGVFFPQVLGMGFKTIQSTLYGHGEMRLLLILIFVKMFATSTSLGSGSSGGVFAPALFVGGCLGAAYGNWVIPLVSFPTASPGAYAMVGMASVFAACFHSPVTAIMLVFEMTHDYRIILPLMGASVIAVSLAQILYPLSIENAKLKRQGIDIGHLEEVRLLRSIRVRDAMTRQFEQVSRDMPAAELYKKMAEEQEKIFFAVDGHGDISGVLPRENAQGLLFEKNMGLFVADDVAEPCLERCFPDDALSDAVEIMHNQRLDFLPVMDPLNSGHLAGVLRSADVFNAYTHLSHRHDDLTGRERHRHESAEGMLHSHFVIPQGAALEGKKIRDLGLPEGVVLTSVERRRKLLAPTGSVGLEKRDKVWAVILPSSKAPFEAWLRAQQLHKHAIFE